MSRTQRKDPVAHRDLAVLEVEDPAILDALSANPKVRQHLWHRFDPHRMVVDAAEVARIAAVLQSSGHESVTRIALDDAP